MMTSIIIGAIAVEFIGIVILLFRNYKTFNTAQTVITICMGVCAVLCILTVGSGFLGLASSLKSFLTNTALSFFGCMLGFAGFEIGNILEQKVIIPAGQNYTREPKNIQHSKPKGKMTPWALPAIVVLMAALAVKALSNILNIILGWAIVIPLEWFDIVTSVLLIIYLIICALSMTPFGLLVFTIIAAISCAGVYFAVWSAGVMITGLIIGAAVSAFLSGILISGIVTGGTVIITSVTAITYTPILIPMIVAVPAGITVAGGLGLIGAAGAAGSHADNGSNLIKKLMNTLINIVLLFAVCIPLLSAFTGLSGIFRSKPGFTYGMQFINRHNLISADNTLDKEPGLGSGKLKQFYASLDVFEDDSHNALQITDDFNIDANRYNIAILHDGILHVYEAGTMKTLAQEACPIKNSKDTVVLVKTSEAYVLGDEDLFIVNYDDPSDVRHYYRKNNPWRNAFLAMSEDEQMDHVYHLLMDTENVSHAPLEDAAIIKLSAQRGQLIEYSLEQKYAIFGRQNDDGTAAFLLQKTPEERNEFGSHAYYQDSIRLPYYWDDYAKYVSVKTDISAIGGVFIDGSQWNPTEMYQGKGILSSNVIHNWNNDYCIMDMTPEKLYVYNYDTDQWTDMEIEPGIAENSSGVLQSGNTLYVFYYPDDGILRKFTYLKDMKEMEDWPFKKKYIESHYHGLRYIYRTLDESFGNGN